MSFKGHTFRPKDSPWTEPADAELRRLCGTGLSTALISETMYDKFSHHFSRNSIIGRMHRLGLKNGHSPGSGVPVRKPARKPPGQSTSHQWASSPLFGKRPSIPLARAAAAPAVIDPATQVSIFDHVEGQCRWPVTEVQPISQFRYCGGPVVDDACPYCAAHWRMSVSKYQPPMAA